MVVPVCNPHTVCHGASVNPSVPLWQLSADNLFMQGLHQGQTSHSSPTSNAVQLTHVKPHECRWGPMYRQINTESEFTFKPIKLAGMETGRFHVPIPEKLSTNSKTSPELFPDVRTQLQSGWVLHLHPTPVSFCPTSHHLTVRIFKLSRVTD